MTAGRMMTGSDAYAMILYLGSMLGVIYIQPSIAIYVCMLLVDTPVTFTNFCGSVPFSNSVCSLACRVSEIRPYAILAISGGLRSGSW
jgi:hypothetical protein